MGHVRHSFLIQHSEFNGTYKNPFKFRGRGIKYTKWRTIDMRSFLGDAKVRFLELMKERDPAKIQRYRVRYKNQTVITPAGRVYERLSLDSKYLKYVETLPGMENEL